MSVILFDDIRIPEVLNIPFTILFTHLQGIENVYRCSGNADIIINFSNQLVTPPFQEKVSMSANVE